MTQHIERKDNENIKDLRVSVSNHTPSWRKYDTGGATFRAYGHIKAEWLALSISEGYNNANGRYVGRDTILTLDKPAALALRDLLNEIYAGQ